MRVRQRRIEPIPVLRLRAAAYRFRESLLLLPALIVPGALIAAEVMPVLDRKGAAASLPLTLGMSSDAAQWFLTAVAGAMITTAGVVFSLTVVSLQLASGQFSPRVMRAFIRDRLSQIVVGLLVATFVYCIVLLRYTDASPAEPAPRLSLTLALVLTVATVFLIIAHLDHPARGLQVGNVVRQIAAEGSEVIDQALLRVPDEHVSDEVPVLTGASFVVRAPRDGWVTQASSRHVLAAVPPGTVIRLDTRAGAYIHEGEPLATLWPVPRDQARAASRLASSVDVAHSRTMQEDIDFALRQLVDIGLRALSPAVNDPTTAVEVVLRLGSLLRKLLVCDLPPEVVSGADGRVLLRPWALNHDEYVAHAFDQLRQTAPSQPHVVAALLRTLRMLIGRVEETHQLERVPALRRQMRLLL